MGVTRRTLIASIGAATTGSVATYALTQESEAAIDANANFSIPDQSHEVSNPVSGAQLAVEGDVTIDAEYVPDSVILRLEAEFTDGYSQLDALKVSDTSKQFSSAFSLRGNLLDVDGLNAHHINPETGNSANVQLDARLKIAVKKDGKTVDSETVQEAFTLGVTKTRGSVSMELNATGETTIETSDG